MLLEMQLFICRNSTNTCFVHKVILTALACSLVAVQPITILENSREYFGKA